MDSKSVAPGAGNGTRTCDEMLSASAQRLFRKALEPALFTMMAAISKPEQQEYVTVVKKCISS